MYSIGEEIIDSYTDERYIIINIIYNKKYTSYQLKNIKTKKIIEMNINDERIDQYSSWRHYMSRKEFEERENWFKNNFSKQLNF